MNPPQNNSLKNSIDNLLTFLSLDLDSVVKIVGNNNEYELIKYLTQQLNHANNSIVNKTIEQEIGAIQEVLFAYSQKDFTKKLAISEYHSNLDALKLTINIQGEELEDLFDELEKKQAIEAQNKEKELLLKEIHHRVKNNLQVITSLLGLQSNTIEDVKVKNIFKTSQHRINSIAMVHELLYQSENISRTESAAYFHQLVKSLLHSYKGFNHRIKVKIQTNNIELNIDTAIPLGLIINEIITNSLKYGIDNDGVLYIKLNHLNDKSYRLQIGDYGTGFPADFDHKSSNSLGIKLIYKLIVQLNGKIERNFENEQGTHYDIYFEEV